jgi:hypothetical protein
LIERSAGGVRYSLGMNYTEASLPQDGVFKIALHGQKTGIASLKINDISGGIVVRSTVFMGAPLEPKSRAKLVLDPAVSPEQLHLTVSLPGGAGTLSQAPDAVLEGAAANDSTPPTTAIRVESGRLTIAVDDIGPAGVFRTWYGTDRAQEGGQVYSGPVNLPEGTTYVWASAVDRAGNAQYPPTVYETCKLPADMDGNGKVETQDIELMASHLGSRHHPAFDLNRDHRVDDADLREVVAALGQRCKPEP